MVIRRSRRWCHGFQMMAITGDEHY
jgi:hypothetical protein